MAESYEKSVQKRLVESLLDCDRFQAGLILSESADRLGTERIFNETIPFALTDIGEKWSRGELALTQIYAASRIIEDAVEQLSPNLPVQSDISCKIVIGSLDYHSLGKNILVRFLKANGVEVIDLGIEVSPERFVEMAIMNNADAILVSSLMYHTCIKAERVKKLISSQNVKIPIMVGGAPFNFDKDLWRRVGADAVGRNVFETFKELQELLKK